MGKPCDRYFEFRFNLFMLYFQRTIFKECTGLVDGKLVFPAPYPVPTEVPIAVARVICDLPATPSSFPLSFIF